MLVCPLVNVFLSYFDLADVRIFPQAFFYAFFNAKFTFFIEVKILLNLDQVHYWFFEWLSDDDNTRLFGLNFYIITGCGFGLVLVFLFRSTKLESLKYTKFFNFVVILVLFLINNVVKLIFEICVDCDSLQFRSTCELGFFFNPWIFIFDHTIADQS